MRKSGEAGQTLIVERRCVEVVVAEDAKRGACADIAVRDGGMAG